MTVAMPKSSTLMVTKIPLGTTNAELESFFSEFGPLKRCFVLKSVKAKAKHAVGYVQFAQQDDADRVLETKSLILKDVELGKKYAKDREPSSKAAGNDGESEALKIGQKTKEQLEFDRKAAKKKKARLIVRNLSFKSTDEDLKKHFEQFGIVTEVNVLKKKDGKMVGCAFIQFSNVPEAAKAIKGANGKPFLDRPIAVDWAVPKEQFRQAVVDKTEVKTEPEDEKDLKSDLVEDEDLQHSSDDLMEVDEEEDDDDNDHDIDDLGSESESELESESEQKDDKKKYEMGHDINEGCTVFIRNVGFESEERELKSLMEDRYGPAVFAKFVIDKLTEHPRGTAFVKFKYPESAKKAVEDREDLTLDGRNLAVSMALSKTDVEIKVKIEKEKEPKDNRNLHLAREGIVREGTKAALGVSKADLAKRTQIEKWKRMMLKNLNMFVSPNRLCVRNLSENFQDSRLRGIFKKFGVLTEAKVIKDLKSTNKCKGYGFVTFKDHDSALKALREINNNPAIFTKDRRPIVEFSIENRKALIARMKRLEKSKMNNPNCKDKAVIKRKEQFEFARKKEKDEIEDKPDFMGSLNNPKQRSLPSHVGPKIRKHTKISRKDLKKAEQQKKNPKKRKLMQVEEGPEEEQERKKEKPKKKKKKKIDIDEVREEKKFNSLVESYKSKLLAASNALETKKKWFSE